MSIIPYPMAVSTAVSLLLVYLLDNVRPMKLLVACVAGLICLTMAERRFEQLVTASDGMEKSLHNHTDAGLSQEFDKYGIIMSGIQLDEVQTIPLRRLSSDNDSEINVIPIIIDFRNLMLSQSKTEILHGVSIISGHCLVLSFIFD